MRMPRIGERRDPCSGTVSCRRFECNRYLLQHQPFVRSGSVLGQKGTNVVLFDGWFTGALHSKVVQPQGEMVNSISVRRSGQ